jgi:hypothetical protein
MPEFILNGQDNPAYRALDDFAKGYVQAMFFADTPEGEDWSFGDLSESAFRKIKEDCASFCADQRTLDLIDGDEERAGRDFWYTRQRHGCGFWDGDRDLVDVEGYLDARARTFGEVYPYKGDDDLIYF